jgi:hypothetical protein
MDHGAWVGLVLIILFFGRGDLRVRADRRSGLTQSFGHPKLDSLLLLVSGLVLALALALGLWLLKIFQIDSNRHDIRFLVCVLMLMLAAGLWWTCSQILRRAQKRS